MNQEQLERLLMDRALGELSSDTSALLDNYLTGRPDLAPLAAELDQTLRDVRSAVSPSADIASTTLPLPPLSPRVVAACHSSTRRRPIFSGLALAACMFLAFLAGRQAATENPDRAMRSSQYAAASATLVESGLWSYKSLAALRGAAQVNDQSIVKWSSPLARPQMGELR